MARPPIYKTAERQTATLDEFKKLIPSKYKKESDFCDKIEDNIEYVTKQLFEEQYIEHTREFEIPLGFRKGRLRVDFLIHTDKNIYLCEVKNPTHYVELRNAIVQLLHYSIFYPDYKLCLITSDYDDVLRLIIHKYKLPIKVFVLTKEKLLILL